MKTVVFRRASLPVFFFLTLWRLNGVFSQEFLNQSGGWLRPVRASQYDESSYFQLLAAGFVIRKQSPGKRKASDMSEDNTWEIAAKFENITYWNHDSLPSKDDAFARSLHLLSVAEAVSFLPKPFIILKVNAWISLRFSFCTLI